MTPFVCGRTNLKVFFSVFFNLHRIEWFQKQIRKLRKGRSKKVKQINIQSYLERLACAHTFQPIIKYSLEMKAERKEMRNLFSSIFKENRKHLDTHTHALHTYIYVITFRVTRFNRKAHFVCEEMVFSFILSLRFLRRQNRDG